MYYEEFRPDMSFELAPVVIEKEKMLDFAEKYDFIPLHTDEKYARQTCFGDLIAPGVMSFMSVWARFLELDPFGDEVLAGKSTRIEWIRPVYAEDVLKGEAVVTGMTRRNRKNGIVEVTITVRNQKNEVVLTDVTETVVKCKLS